MERCRALGATAGLGFLIPVISLFPPSFFAASHSCGHSLEGGFDAVLSFCDDESEIFVLRNLVMLLNSGLVCCMECCCLHEFGFLVVELCCGILAWIVSCLASIRPCVTLNLVLFISLLIDVARLNQFSPLDLRVSEAVGPSCSLYICTAFVTTCCVYVEDLEALDV
ncbi:hypothetical protein Nepgr_002655 [Nepenthes gracilis]|uniref:Uncharacterized protein n=1 Tax=Nepenthes gracilis TaxID=150966 RepID=A0AAD3RYE2_NEPGR|nr:hypothetical protein Nepgr_002655 [Nepenthes gracilis]